MGRSRTHYTARAKKNGTAILQAEKVAVSISQYQERLECISSAIPNTVLATLPNNALIHKTRFLYDELRYLQPTR